MKRVSMDIDQKVSNMETTRFYLWFYNNLHGVYFDIKFEKKSFFISDRLVLHCVKCKHCLSSKVL